MSNYKVLNCSVKYADYDADVTVIFVTVYFIIIIII